jgi:hypothetical protein
MPRKALWLAMETDPSTEFDHYLATKLGKFLWEIHTMAAEEYARWCVYFGRKAQREELEMAKAGR